MNTTKLPQTTEAHAVGVPVEREVRPARNVDALRLQHADTGPGLRWFIRRGATTWFDRGFKTKARASAWIADHGPAIDWRCGYLFRLRGDSRDVQIVSRRGEPVRA